MIRNNQSNAVADFHGRVDSAPALESDRFEAQRIREWHAARAEQRAEQAEMMRQVAEERARAQAAHDATPEGRAALERRRESENAARIFASEAEMAQARADEAVTYGNVSGYRRATTDVIRASVAQLRVQDDAANPTTPLA